MQRSNLILLAAALCLGAGCAKTDEARVDRYEYGVYQPQTVSAYTISGARDGAATDAKVVFALESGDTLRVFLHVTYNPTPVLADGHWQLDRAGSTGEDGAVREESLKFLGGQGATPSVGGRFRLESNGVPRWRVVLPVRPLK